MKKIVIFVLCLIMLFALCGCDVLKSVVGIDIEPAPTAIPTSTPTAAPTTAPFCGDGELTVYLIDVGQGDSILLISPSGKTMLIDAGDGGAFDAISSQLTKLNITSLDVVVVTHPHADHIGSMAKVINSYEIGSFYMTDFVATTKTYERMLTALEDNNVSVYQATSDTLIAWDEDVTVQVLSPIVGIEYDDSNTSSIVMKVSYGNSSIMLTGDAEKETEGGIIALWGEDALKADVLKLGHHGSSTSSSLEFVVAVDPDIALCSLGVDNDYGHPHRETLELMAELNIPLYRTDLLGTIKIVLDGTDIQVIE